SYENTLLSGDRLDFGVVDVVAGHRRTADTTRAIGCGCNTSRRAENWIGTRVQSSRTGQWSDATDKGRPGGGSLHGLDDRRQGVRQLGDARNAVDLRRRADSSWPQRGNSADGGWRNSPAVDSGITGL